ncbi:MAG: NUDIX hydrolase [Paracoccaceae bacterium]|nr:NUDIX hydrolase [Paracoccaceae bacterium]
MTGAFAGAKLAILVGEQIVIILRDDKPDIPWPGYWDLPGGARDGSESPQTCVLRETREELGLVFKPNDLAYARHYAASPGPAWFYALEAPGLGRSDIRFGDEGQRWAFAPLAWYVEAPDVIPHHRDWVAAYLGERRA